MTCEGLGKRLRDLENGGVIPSTNQPRVVVPDFTCTSSAVPGDFVVEDISVARKLNVVTSNTKEMIPHGVLGVIFEKQSSTSCSLLILGLVSGASGLQFGKPIFVGTDGKIAQTKPAIGTSHRVGIAISATEYIFNPSQNFRQTP